MAVFYGEIENGKLKICRKKEFESFFNKTKGRVSIEIKKIRKIRSLNQNALYWMWLEIISNDLGYDREELHDTFKAMFLTDRSQKVPLVRSTSKLNKIQFGLYLDKIERIAAGLGIRLPQPGEDYYANIFKESLV